VQNLARRAVETFGRIDGWVNNAGVTLFGRLDEVPMEAFRRVIETNLFGYIYGARAVLPHFRQRGQGVLVNVASIIAKVGSPYVTAYAISKYAVLGLSDSLRQELMDTPGIHVCTILPASIDTPLFQHAANYTGQAVKALTPVYPATQVARTIARCLEYPRRELAVGGAAERILVQRALAPGMTERQMSRKVRTDHFQDRPAKVSSGNLFQPTAATGRISGDWRRNQNQSSSSISLATAVGIGLGTLAAGYVALRWLRPTPMGQDGHSEEGAGAATEEQYQYSDFSV
jgi:NAD(P)-dependent dehydrogenase (short-subunit alcohol dehydrogenase family)